MNLDQILWKLPVAIALQMQLVWLQMQGRDLVIERDPSPLLVRLKKARGVARG
jgi:hypothetical protein